MLVIFTCVFAITKSCICTHVRTCTCMSICVYVCIHVRRFMGCVHWLITLVVVLFGFCLWYWVDSVAATCRVSKNIQVLVIYVGQVCLDFC